MTCSMDLQQLFQFAESVYEVTYRPRQFVQKYFLQDGLLEVCYGCAQIQSSYEIGYQYYEYARKWITCLESYYFDNGCYQCLDYCQSCKTNNTCEQCQNNFYYDTSKNLCIYCMEGCISCEYSNSTQVCLQCSKYNYTLSIEKTCIKCPDFCEICDYYGGQLRCLKCFGETEFFLSLNGVACIPNQINYCRYAIQYQAQDITQNTLILNFTSTTQDVVTECALCYRFYHYNVTSQECVYVNSALWQFSEDPVVIQVKSCQNGYFTVNQFICFIGMDDNSHQVLFQVQKCTFIKNCYSCLYEWGEAKYICVRCISGYYADVFDGQCYQCPMKLNCDTCVQQYKYTEDAWKWNIRAYYEQRLNYFLNSTFQDQAISKNADDFEIICLGCTQGYILYMNQCIAVCPLNCAYCVIIDNKNKCITCKVNIQGRLMTYDNQDCLVCSPQCLICKSRSQEQIYNYNPYFNRQDSLLKFSYLCLNVMPSQIADGSYSVYNGYLGQFIQCSQPQVMWQCKKIISLSLHVQCSKKPQNFVYDSTSYNIIYLEDLLEGDIQPSFPQFNNDNFYTAISEIQIQELFINLLFNSDSMCQFPSKGVIVNQFSYNIFPLQNVSLIFVGSTNSSLTLQNLSIRGFSKVDLLNLAIIFPQFTIIQMQHLQFVQVYFAFVQISGSMFQMQLDNCSNITFESFVVSNIHFVNLQSVIMMNQQFIGGSVMNFKNSSLIMGLEGSIFFNSAISSLQLQDMILMIDCNQCLLFSQILQTRVMNLKLIHSNIYFGQIFYLTTSINIVFINTTIQHSVLSQSSFIVVYQQFHVSYLTIVKSNISNSKIITTTPSATYIGLLQYLTFHSNQGLGLIFEFVSPNLHLIIRNVSISDMQYYYPNDSALPFDILNANLSSQLRLVIFWISTYSVNISDCDIHRAYGTEFYLYNIQLVHFTNLIAITFGPETDLQFEDIYNNLNVQNSIIYIQNSLNILFDQLMITNTLFGNQACINIIQTESIHQAIVILSNSHFMHNILSLSQNYSQTSLVLYYSQNADEMIILNNEFKYNQLNVYEINQNLESAIIFMVDCLKCNLLIRNNSFQGNTVFNSMFSIFYYLVFEVQMESSRFVSNNLLNQFNSKYYLIFNNNRDLTQQIMLFSQSGNGIITSTNILLNNISINDSSGLVASGFIVNLQNSGFLDINYFIAENLSNAPVYAVTSQAQILKMNVNNSQFINITSSTTNGVFFIGVGARFNDLNFANLYFKDVQSAFAHCFNFIFSDYSESNVYISNIEITNSFDSFYQFMQIQQPSTQGSYSRTFLYQSYGQLIIKNFSVYNSFMDKVFDLDFTQKVMIEGLSIRNSTNFILNLMDYTAKTNSSLIITNSDISYNQQYPIQTLINQSPNNPLIKQIQLTNNSQILSYFSLDITFPDSSIILQSIRFYNNSCPFCMLGLLQIQTTIANLVEIERLVLINNNCGYSCFVTNQNIIMRILNANDSIQETFIINTYYCRDNQAINGSCLNVRSADLLINNSQFLNNSANFGGALYLGGKMNQVSILNSKFSGNKANIGGAIYTESQIEQKFINVFIEDNDALFYGDNIVSTPTQLSIQYKDFILDKITVLNDSTGIQEQIFFKSYSVGNRSNINVLYFPSGQHISEYQFFDQSNSKYIDSNISLHIIAQNMYYEKLQNLNGTSCSLSARPLGTSAFTNKYTNPSIFKFNETTQDYNLDFMIIYFESGESNILEVEVKCDCIAIPIYNNQYPFELLHIETNYSLRFNLSTFACQIGEYWNSTDKSCYRCDPKQNQYSVQLDATQCSIIDDTVVANSTAGTIQLRQGFWRPYVTTQTITNCYNKPSNCQGGWIPGTESCNPSYIGALCESCDLFNVRGGGSYMITTKYSCKECTNYLKEVAVLCVLSLWIIFSIFLSVKSNLDAIRRQVLMKKVTLIGFQHEIQFGWSTILFKMLNNYFTILGSITTFQITIPSLFDYILSSFTNQQNLLQFLDCFISIRYDLPIIYTQTIQQIIVPFVYITIFYMIYGLLISLKQIRWNICYIYTSTIYIFIYFQTNIIGKFISLGSYRIISGYQWIQGNVAYRFDTHAHYVWLLSFVLPGLILIGVLIPLFLYNQLFKIRYNLLKRKSKAKLGYLYNEYNYKSYFWELIKIIEKEWIIIILTFYSDYIVVKGCLVFLIIQLYLILSQLQKPYGQNNLNNLDYQINLICGISIFLGVGLSASQQNDTVIYAIIYSVLTLLNLAMLLQIISNLVLAYSVQFQSQISSIKTYINVKFPNLQSRSELWNKILSVNKSGQSSQISSSIASSRFKQSAQQIISEIRSSSSGSQIGNVVSQPAALSSYEYAQQSQFNRLDTQVPQTRTLQTRTETQYNIQDVSFAN